MESREARKKHAAVEALRKEFESAWKNADTKLRVEDL